MLNLKIVGYIPNFIRTGLYPEFARKADAKVIPFRPATQRAVATVERAVPTADDIKRANILKYKKGVMLAWKKRNRNHKDTLLCSSSIN